jgi:Metallo-peptidase family M12B Reprolysin-like/Secretion system C-terminal sorting domain
MKLFYKTLLLALVLAPIGLLAQNNFFTDASEASMKSNNQKRLIVPTKFRAMALDTLALKAALKTAPMELSDAAKNNPLIVELPMPEGGTMKFTIVEYSMMEPGLAAKFPNFKTYSGQGVDDRTATLKMDWTELGFHAMVRSAITDGFTIDPYSVGNKTGYIIYTKKDLPAKQFKEGELEQAIQQEVGSNNRTQAGFCFGSQLRTYRLAVACTGEYGTLFGGTVAGGLAAIVNTVNRVNGVYETEVAIRLTLVSNNNLIVFTNATTDPFTQTAVNTALLNENQTAIDFYIGSGFYDIGHLVCTIDGGGLAQTPAVCTSGKSRGATGLANPSGDNYDIDFVAHEMGHQFSSNHSFNALTGNCTTRNAATAVEPGSGVTIMGYAGICTATNDLAAHSIPYFHSRSQLEIGNYSNTGAGNSCATTTSTGNAIPVVNAGSNFTIPAGTPFALTGSATDANGDALTYSWEQIDVGAASANWNSGSSPFFRTFSPTVSSTRYFPRLNDVAAGTTTIGEFLPSTTQTLNFRLTVRDNRMGGGGVCSNEMVLNTVAGTPFTVTSQNTVTNWAANGTNTATITWNVAGTTAAPFNTANVAILFSADGGLTFPYTLSASTANNGTANVVIPAVATTNGRVMVKAVGNVFFNLNSANITVTAASCIAEGAVIAPATSVTALAGSASLNLSLSPQYSTPFAASGSVTITDPSSNLTVFSSVTSACQNFSNKFNYDVYPFVASVTGSYTFQRTGAGSIFNIYSGTYDPTNGCSSFLASNATYNGTALSTSATLTVTLNAGTPYTLVIGVYGADANTSATTLPFAYSFAITATPTGGSLFNGTGVYANPGAGFSYSYVMVNNTTNNIVGISSTANLSNATTYPASTYAVYGLSYNNSIAASLPTYVGGSFTTLTNAIIGQPATYCGNLSKNTVSVTVTAVLPVNFIALKARKVNSTVALDWGTASEQNTSHFDVQRSADGINFITALGKINAAGNSSIIKNYNLVDAKPLKGWNYYRIKQVDLDGKFAYSNIAPINFEKENVVMLVYPNPAINVLTIEYASAITGKLQIQITDAKGATVLQQNQQVVAGRNTNTLNISNLAAGMYVLKSIDANGNTSFTKFVKQ